MIKSWVATEAINYQGTAALFEPLVDKLKQLKATQNYTNEEAARIGIASLIYDKTGVSVSTQIVDLQYPQAAIQIPNLDRNHPLIADIIRWSAGDKSVATLKKIAAGDLVGVVDREKGKVYGALSKLVCPLYITTEFFTNEAFTMENLAATILHEVGHVFTYYEMLGDVCTKNYAVACAANDMFNKQTVSDRIKVLESYERILGSEIDDKKTVAEGTDKTATVTHLLCSATYERRNEDGSTVYSYRGFEFLADQFATRHGAGKYLGETVRKLAPLTATSATAHYATELFKFSTLVANIVFTATTYNFVFLAIQATYILMVRPMDKLYDDPLERIERIEREMRGELRDRKLSDVRRKQVLADIDAMVMVKEGVKDRKGIMDIIWEYVIPSGRSERKATEFQQELEKLTNNELYVAAARLDAVDRN